MQLRSKMIATKFSFFLFCVYPRFLLFVFLSFAPFCFCTGTTKVKVVNYIDVLNGTVKVGKNVAVIGAGGIGFDVSDFLTHDHASAAPGQEASHAGAALPNKVDAQAVNAFLEEWGVDSSIQVAGGLKKDTVAPVPARKVIVPLRVCLFIYL